MIARPLLVALAVGACAHAPNPSPENPPRAPTPEVPPPPIIATAPSAIATVDASSAETCHSRHLGVPTEHRIAACSPNLVAQGVAWDPDVLVALGGGILAPGLPACSTVQRAHATWELFEALGRRPWMLLSGLGPPEPDRPVDPTEARCATARLAQEARTPHLDPATRELVDHETHALVTAHRASLTEADYLCAAILARYPEPERDAVRARMLFEPRSTTTVANARYSSQILGTRDLRRALIVSTPVVHADRSVDNHPERALGDFRADRTAVGHSVRLGAIGCPFVDGGPSWEELEPAH